jgi:thymidylate synthase ThyX
MKDYLVRVICDSVSPDGVRLTTIEATYPRFIHAELMTHRVFSRNAASSRAIPVQKMIEQVDKNPAYPIWWGKNQSGMQAREELDEHNKQLAQAAWNRARLNALAEAENMVEYGAHKQLVNRILEPFAWITVLITATDWENFLVQRLHEDAQPELRFVAQLVAGALQDSAVQQIPYYSWHLPLIQPDEMASIQDVETLKRISVARCARVSYLTHDGVRDHQKDLDLYDRLVSGGANGHWSPFEHVATPANEQDNARIDMMYMSSNLRGWNQFRKYFPQENQQ